MVPINMFMPSYELIRCNMRPFDLGMSADLIKQSDVPYETIRGYWNSIRYLGPSWSGFT